MRRLRDRYRRLPEDAWTRLVVQAVRGAVTGPRRRVGDPEGVRFRLALLWGGGGPIFLVDGLRSVVAEPGEVGGWATVVGGAAWVASWLLYLRRPATVPRQVTMWGGPLKPEAEPLSGRADAAAKGPDH